jgi:hypothetical protein
MTIEDAQLEEVERECLLDEMIDLAVVAQKFDDESNARINAMTSYKELAIELIRREANRGYRWRTFYSRQDGGMQIALVTTYREPSSKETEEVIEYLKSEGFTVVRRNSDILVRW